MKYIDLADAQINYVMQHPTGMLLFPQILTWPVEYGDLLTVRERLWVSDEGNHYAMLSPGDMEMRDVVKADGSGGWFRSRSANYEGQHLVTSFRNLGRRTQKGNWIDAFELGMTDITYAPERTYHTGPTIPFHRQMAASRMPSWAHRMDLWFGDKAHITWDALGEVGRTPKLDRIPVDPEVIRVYASAYNTAYYPQGGFWQVEYRVVKFDDLAYRKRFLEAHNG